MHKLRTYQNKNTIEFKLYKPDRLYYCYGHRHRHRRHLHSIIRQKKNCARTVVRPDHYSTLALEYLSQ